MAAKIIDGSKFAKEIKEEVKASVAKLKEKGKTPAMAVVIVGEDPASKVYVNTNKKACDYVGINCFSYEFPETISQDDLLAKIAEINNNKDINGILIQLPLPKHIDEDKVLLNIKPEKDLDCFNPYTVGRLHIGKKTFAPCTPYGVIELLKRSNIEMAGANCVVIGRSNIVGKPVASLLLAENATVTICHSKTKNLKEVCLGADILVAALGKPKFVTKDMVKKGAVVVDVGIHRLEDKSLCGDVDFDDCKENASEITPVPGGVGPMTISMLMKNCLEAFENQNS